MGSAYARGVLDCPRPRVGLMSLGEEETKGSELVREVHEVLKASSLNFVGNVEGHDLFTGKVDVVVMDGFTGNVVLKACETLAELVIDLIREEVGRDVRGQARGLPPQARLPRRPTAQRPGRDRRGAPPRPQGLLRDRPRQGEGPRREARHPHRRVLPLERGQRRDRGGAARPRRAQGGGERMSVAFVFPGQGSQEVGMGRALSEAFPESRAAFEEADAALGFALSRLCFEGPEADLQLTANTQPAILAASVAALRPLLARGAAPGLGGRAQPGRVLGARRRRRDRLRGRGAHRPPARRVHAGGGAGRGGGHGRDPRPRPAGDRGGVPRGRRGRGRLARQRELAGPGRDRRARGGRGPRLRALPGAGARSAR